MKKIMVLLTLLILLSGCNETITYKESSEFYAMEENTEDMVVFLDSLKTYVAKFDEGFILGSIQLKYNNTYELEIYFEFTKKISKNKTSSLFLNYDYERKGVQYSRYYVGTPKGHTPFDKELDTTKWKINFEQGLERLRKELVNKGVSSFKRIGCYCYEKEWLYSVFFSDEYEDRIEIAIPTS